MKDWVDECVGCPNKEVIIGDIGAVVCKLLPISGKLIYNKEDRPDNCPQMDKGVRGILTNLNIKKDIDKIGLHIIIRIDGKPYDTYIDDGGIQRFPRNNLLSYISDRGQIMNELAAAYGEGKFTIDEYMQFYRDIGYSVGGFGEVFDEVNIENPLWEEVD